MLGRRPAVCMALAIPMHRASCEPLASHTAAIAVTGVRACSRRGHVAGGTGATWEPTLPGSSAETGMAKELRIGGLGLCSAERTVAAAYWGSWADTLSMHDRGTGADGRRDGPYCRTARRPPLAIQQLTSTPLQCRVGTPCLCTLLRPPSSDHTVAHLWYLSGISFGRFALSRRTVDGGLGSSPL